MNEPNAGRLGPDKAIRSMAILAAGGHCGHSDVVDDEGQAKACIPSPSRHNAKGAPGLNACHFCHHQRSVCDLNPSKREAMPPESTRRHCASTGLRFAALPESQLEQTLDRVAPQSLQCTRIPELCPAAVNGVAAMVYLIDSRLW